ncbi:MAG: site-specific integrase [Bryobacteraceae bacterium]
MTGHIRPRGKRSWAIVLELGRDPATGKRRQKWHTVHGTKKRAQAEVARLINELESGSYVEPRRLSVRDFLERWLDDAETKVSGTTYQRYRSIVRLHLEKALGHVPLAKLQPLHIQTYLAEALKVGRVDARAGRGLAPRTVCHHYRVLSEALGRAVKWQLLARNPAVAVEPPRVEQQEINAIDENAAARLVDAARGTRLYIPILLAVTTGMRRGEILALRWNDVDLVRGFVTVVRSLEETKQSGLRFKETKKKRSRRPISMPGLLTEALDAHRILQLKHREMYGGDYGDNDLVCCREDGSVWPPSAFTSAYRDLVRRRKIAKIRFHDLRHSHASQLLRSGVNPKVISERLGHSKVGFTLEVYAHLLPGMQEEAAKLTDSKLRAAIEFHQRQSG